MRIKESKGSQVFDMFNMLFMIFLIFVMLYPLYYIFIVSISDGKAVLAGEVTFWPINLTLESYKLVFKNPDIMMSYKNTLIYVGLGTVINLLMTSLCAYPLSQPDFPGKKMIMKLHLI